MSRKMTCLLCPRGCLLTVDDDGTVSGNYCPRGLIYAKQEMSEPKRMLTFSVKIENEQGPLPVKTSNSIPKDKIFDVVEYLKTVTVSKPISFNQVIVSNVLGLGVDIVASEERL